MATPGIEEIDIPTIVLPYQFEPLALTMSECRSVSDVSSGSILI